METPRYVILAELLKTLEGETRVFEQDRLIRHIENELQRFPGVMRAEVYSELELDLSEPTKMFEL